jgi:hypothetical protein
MVCIAALLALFGPGQAVTIGYSTDGASWSQLTTNLGTGFGLSIPYNGVEFFYTSWGTGWEEANNYTLTFTSTDTTENTLRIYWALRWPPTSSNSSWSAGTVSTPYNFLTWKGCSTSDSRFYFTVYNWNSWYAAGISLRITSTTYTCGSTTAPPATTRQTSQTSQTSEAVTTPGQTQTPAAPDLTGSYRVTCGTCTGLTCADMFDTQYTVEQTGTYLIVRPVNTTFYSEVYGHLSTWTSTQATYTISNTAVTCTGTYYPAEHGSTLFCLPVQNPSAGCSAMLDYITPPTSRSPSAATRLRLFTM